jgi:translation initiation factor eIF-2B subunit delta
MSYTHVSFHNCSNLLLLLLIPDPHEHGDLFFSVQLGGPLIHRPTKLHPAVLETGRAYAMSSILGANARCRAMLLALRDAIGDYIPPVDGDLRNHVNNQVLKPSFTYWTQECRPHSVSMGNAFTFVKSAVVAALDRDMAWEDCRLVLQESIDAYIQERINYADLAIASVAFEMISNGDVILTYAKSEAIQVVLLEAHKMKTKKFRVIVVDAKPLFEGKVLLRALREAGLDCTYILLNALSYVMKDVTKVLLGAKGLLNDGSVYGRVGTACVAMVAKDIPVLVCAETYKISNRVQLEAFTNNEQGNPQDVVEGELGDNLRVINLLYDLTPAASISGIITEMGILPPTSVAVLLREMTPQNAYSEF